VCKHGTESPEQWWVIACEKQEEKVGRKPMETKLQLTAIIRGSWGDTYILTSHPGPNVSWPVFSQSTVWSKR